MMFTRSRASRPVSPRYHLTSHEDPSNASTPNTATSNTRTPSPVGSTQQSGNTAARSTNAETNWYPLTLRWYFLLLPIILTLVFGISVICLHLYSRSHHGLGRDDGSSMVLFAWRFLPTLVAVLYTQITVIIFEDVKRTEPFARLASSPPTGTSAYGTLLQSPKSWWGMLYDMTFKRKQMGKTGWSLVFALLVHVLALLAISPLSSALLATEEVLVPQTIDFTRTVPTGNVRASMNGTRETYMRIMANITRNMSNSPWTSDDSFTLPFWPSSGERQMQSKISSDYRSWEAQTTTFNTGYTCENMTLESAELHNRTYSVKDWHSTEEWMKYNGTTPMVTYRLNSPSGCRYELSVNPAVDISWSGGIHWSDATTFNPTSGTFRMDHLAVDSGFGEKHPWSRLNASKECKGQDVIIINTPWTAPVAEEDLMGMAPSPSIWHRSPEFRMRALLCNSTYTAKTETLKMSMAFGQPAVVERSPGATTHDFNFVNASFELNGFQAASTDTKWGLYFGEPEKNVSPDEAEKSPHNSPSIIGLGVVLGLHWNYSISSMLEDPDLVATARKIKGRIFAETVQDAFDTPEAFKKEVVQGTAIALQERVVVLPEISTTLCVLFLVSFLLLLALLWFSRVQRRPLQLQTDPGSTIGLGALLDPQRASLAALKEMHSASRQEIRVKLRSETFRTSNGTLHHSNGTFGSAAPNGKKIKSRDWRPRAIHLKNLFALCSFLLLIGAAIFVLYTFAASSKLYQKVFTYETDLSRLGLSISSFAPISIAPAVISIAITLWWDQIDATFRLLQPYIAMSQEPTPMYRGAGLTYRSKSWFGAAVKAARNRHWILFMVAMGSTLCQVLTVSMSALFERRMDNVSRQVSVNRTLQVRRYPLVSSMEGSPADAPLDIVQSMFSEYSSNWIYNAAMQVAMDGEQPGWTKDDWSFVPFDLLQTINPSNRSGTLGSDSSTAVSPNVTITTSAIRVRIECDTIPAVQNTSSWLSGKSEEGAYNVTNIQESTGIQDFTSFRRAIFKGTSAATTILGNEKKVQCCQNGTSERPNPAAIGYWSATDPSVIVDVDYNLQADPERVKGYPYQYRSWPLTFVPKWIVGKPIVASYMPHYEVFKEVIFQEEPKMQAALCKPIIETAEASVSVDQKTGSVHSYNLAGPPGPLNSAWSDVFFGRNVSNPDLYHGGNITGPQNFTTSFGVLFFDTLFRAADSEGGTDRTYEKTQYNAFNFRDEANGLNLDLMTYSMYVMAGKDPQALLNYTTLVTTANRTLQTFFQQFVQASLNLTSGGYVFQAIKDDTMTTIGQAIDLKGNAISQPVYPALNTEPSGVATVTNRIQVLYLNPIATFLSIGILIWLIGTAVVIICVQRRYTRSMMRNVELIADVMVLVAGSENFLKMIQERGMALKRDKNICTRLGWFKGRDGQVRWGVEVVGGRNAVEWVDAPKSGTI